MSVTISSSVGVSLVSNPTTIQFYPTKLHATIFLYINDATLWTVGRTTNLIITPLDTLTYALGATISLTGVAALIAVPNLALTTSATNLKSMSFSVNCTQHGQFNYHIARKFSYNATACTLTSAQIQYWS